MPSRYRLKYLMLPLLAASAALASGAAFATLGETESSIQADGEALRGSIKQADHLDYRAHEITLPSGTLVREYANLDGTVFAVSWSGRFMPNLRQMLGRYFDTYTEAVKNRRQDRHHLNVESGALIVQAHGHGHAFSGRAFLPAAVPPGVVVQELP